MMLQQKSMCDQKSFYDILGVPPDATLPEMKIAHRRLFLNIHPDKRDSSSRKGADRDEECRRRTRMVEDESGDDDGDGDGDGVETNMRGETRVGFPGDDNKKSSCRSRSS